MSKILRVAAAVALLVSIASISSAYEFLMSVNPASAQPSEGLYPGDAVIVPTLTFLATANAARMAGAETVRILYGGSVKADNAETLMAIDNVDGALVGGASLAAADFWPIIKAVL